MVEHYADYAFGSSPLFDLADFDEIADFLEQSQATQREQLEEELAAIATQLAERDRIHERIVDQLEWKIERYTDRLGHLYRTGRGKTDGRRERLKDRIEAFYQDLRDEDREHWRDRQELEQERRTIRRELDEVDADTWSELLEGSS